MPITQRAIAAIMLDHLPDDTTTREAMYTDRTDEKGTIGADLRYSGGGESDGDLVRASLVPGTREQPCEERCVELGTDVEAASLTMHWDEVVPEEDPGIVAVVLQREGEYAYVYQSGPTITKDPRELDLAISVDEMVGLAEDAWLRLKTSPDAVDAGQEVEDWESDDLEYGVEDPVPHRPRPARGIPRLRGQRSPVRRPPALAAQGGAGPDAIGGRMTIPAENGYVSARKRWSSTSSPPRTPRPGSAVTRARAGRSPTTATATGVRWATYLRRPATTGDPGLVWVGNVRDDEVVAIRIRGFPVPQKRVALVNNLGAVHLPGPARPQRATRDDHPPGGPRRGVEPLTHEGPATSR